ncbi:MAG: NADH-quinone oxidoreductase subunit D [Prolixibacteraceae bacterium]|nr:NADH-quinone oxidoreductase subunit D [Prolixibacteraceae bacterium]
MSEIREIFIDSEILKTDDYSVNMGPQHPSTHGVLRLLVTLEGEIVLKVKPYIGYIHSGIEKMCESLAYPQIVHLTDRMDYLSAHMNNEAVCLCVENALQVEVPDRVKYIRTIMDELMRISSHQLWWSAYGMDMGAQTALFYGMRDREKILDIFEETFGARVTLNYNVPGGVMFDIHPNFVKRVKDFVKDFRKKLIEYDNLLSFNVIFRERTVDIGHLSIEDAIDYGVTGPSARASGFSCDVRKHHPYSAYPFINFNEILDDKGDTFARYYCRIREMHESLNIIEQLIDNIPEGDFAVKMKGVIKLPEGEYFQQVESSKGVFGVFIVSDGKKNPYRVKFRSPGFSNLFALNKMVKGFKIADLIAIMGSLDLVIPDIDR